jgi:hypothetical protein
MSENWNICGVCVGNPLTDRPCICGGTGTMDGELQGLRERLYDVDQEIASLRDQLAEARKTLKFIASWDCEDFKENGHKTCLEAFPESLCGRCTAKRFLNPPPAEKGECYCIGVKGSALNVPHSKRDAGCAYPAPGADTPAEKGVQVMCATHTFVRLDRCHPRCRGEYADSGPAPGAESGREE